MKSIFISSTFRDMQAERDEIQLNVLPEVRELLKQYGQNIDFIDLRWGVDTTDLESDEGARKVLTVCFNEIENSKPYIIVLLGERYGWVPDPDLINADLNELMPENISYENKSVTTLEIEYGAFSQKHLKDQRCFFYFREPLNYEEIPEEYRSIYQAEDEESSAKLAKLKERIRKDFPDSIRSYSAKWDNTTNRLTGFEDFNRIVLEDISNSLKNEFKNLEALDWQEEENLQNQRLIEEKNTIFAGREALLDQIIQDSVNSELIVLNGTSGSGKSTLFSALIAELEDEGANVLSSFCGISNQSSSYTNILKRQVYNLENLLGYDSHFEGDNYLKLKDYWETLLEEYSKNNSKPLYILLDAIDQLTEDEIRNNLLFLPDKLPDNVRIIVSCRETFPLPKMLPLINPKVIQLEELTTNESEKIINSLLKVNRKEVNDIIKKELVYKSEDESPLYLNLLINNLILMNSEDFEIINQRENETQDGMDSINSYLLKKIQDSPGTTLELCSDYLDNAAERINEDQSALILTLLSGTRFGLRNQDLQGIFEKNELDWNSLDFSRLQLYISSFINQREDGRIDFNHQLLRDSVVNSLDKEDIDNVNIIIEDWLDTLPFDDDVKIHEFFYHNQNTKNEDHLYKFIKDINRATKKEKNIAAIELRTLLLKNPNSFDWIFESSNQNLVLEFGNFLSDELIDVFNQTTKEYRIVIDLLYKYLEYLDSLKNTAGENEEEAKEISLKIVKTYHIAGSLYEDLGQTENAAVFYKLALNLLEDLDDNDELLLQIINERNDLSRVKIKQLDLSHAYTLQGYNEFDINKLIVNEGYDNTRELLAQNYETIGSINYNLKNYSGALDAYERGLAVRKIIFNNNSSNENKRKMNNDLIAIGDTLVRKRKYQQAQDVYEQSRQYSDEIYQELGDSQSRFENAYSNFKLAELLYQSGDDDRASQMFSRLLPTFDSLVNELDSSKVLDTYNTISSRLKELKVNNAEVKNVLNHEKGQEDIVDNGMEPLKHKLAKVIFKRVGIKNHYDVLSYISSFSLIFSCLFFWLAEYLASFNSMTVIPFNPLFSTAFLTVTLFVVKYGLLLYVGYVFIKTFISVYYSYSSAGFKYLYYAFIAIIELLLLILINNYMNTVIEAIYFETTYITTIKGTIYILVTLSAVLMIAFITNLWSSFFTNRDYIMNTINQSGSNLNIEFTLEENFMYMFKLIFFLILISVGLWLFNAFLQPVLWETVFIDI